MTKENINLKGFGEIILKGLEPKNKNSEKNSIIKF